ncbi:hypothetical protein OAF05_01025 [bacterium]|nr:hypothetical protein [bacterium]
MKKISVSRILEESYLKKIFNQDQGTINYTIVDLGGERNHYNILFKTYFKHVLTYNLSSRMPDQVVDLTKDFYHQLSADKPDYIISVNTIEHLADDSYLFESCLKYANNYPVIIQIICPFMHKIHAAPHDFRRYTNYGLEKKIKDHLQNLPQGKNNIYLKITPIGGSMYTLMSSMFHQKSRILGTIMSLILNLMENIENVIKLLLKKTSSINKPNASYALGYVIEINSCLK